jgi:cytochrome c-type biogenesis protein
MENVKRTSIKCIVFVISIIFLLAIISISVSAQKDLPIGLQKIIDFNKQSTTDFAVKVSFFIAFVAGLLGILSPCVLPFLPAYFSYTFKERKNITWMTFIFFLGFSLIFVAMGIIAGFIGEQTLSVIQQGWLVTLAGIFMIVLGITSLLGKKVCSYINIHKKFKNDTYGTFLFGMFFAVGWTACLGPILAGILGIGVILGNIWYSGLLLFFYSLGNLVPLFILSIFYDKFKLSQSKFIQGKILTLSILKKKFHIHSTNLISGILFLIIGIVLVIFKGTAIINTLDIFGTRSYFYSIQRTLIEWKYANITGIILFLLFIIVVGRFLWKYKK